MRTNSFITDLWSRGGPYLGDRKPHGRVTVQLPWDDLSGDHKYDVLRTTYDLGTGNYRDRGLPLRWYQDAANNQAELEVPNVKTIHTTRSIDSDAATFEIEIYNQQMFPNGGALGAKELGQPGYFTSGRGVSLDAQARWGQQRNEWENLLVPNALLRTYQGYGGTDLSIDDAVAAGNIMLTGIWFVDHVEVHTDGMIRLSGRDAAKLLIDQQLYPPLVPKEKYPLTYYRWVYFNQPVRASQHTVTISTTITPGDKATNYETSSVDAWYDSIYGHDMLLHGHRPSDAFDGNPDTFFLGEGNSRPDAAFAVNWLQATCGEEINSVYINPWAGNYTCYVSVMENGAWQGDPNNLIPYDPAELYGTQPYVVDTGANIPFVASFGIPWETPAEYMLPRAYKADRVRITLRDLTYTEWGPWQYRGGIREFKIRASDGTGAVTTGGSQTLVFDPLFIAADSHPESGYVTSDMSQEIDAFGAARVQPWSGGQLPTNDAVWSLRVTASGNGYYALTHTGRITCYGDAAWQGDPQTDGFVHANSSYRGDRNCADMALTPSGNGYWVLDTTGKIWNYGDASAYTDVTASNNGSGQTFCHSIDSHPTNGGVWVLDSNGKVFTRGSTTSYGDLSPMLDRPIGTQLDMARLLRCTSAGDGYWILTTKGHVEAKGSATFVGEPDLVDPYVPDWRDEYWSIMPHADDSGYLVMKGDGTITDYGPTGHWYYGSPIPGQMAQQRKDGNYKDYSDIIRDLALWSGFLFYDPTTSGNATPDVYGNIESTGAWSDEDLPTDIFDKRPVIDAMHSIKEVVGYLLWVDDEGAFRFESPNWWAPGNFDEFGSHTNTMLQLDEAVTLLNYTATFTDDALRSLIIISSEDPDDSTASTVTTRLVPTSKKQLRGLCKPAMWVNGYFIKPEEQKIMAELIALHTWFQTRVGQVTCVANPCLQINDQVRIWERQSSESYVHYVRGVDTTMDLDAGSYTMTVTTNWLGDETSWAIQDSGSFVSTADVDDPRATWFVSSQLAAVLRGQFQSQAANSFANLHTPVLTQVVPGSQSGTGAAGP